MTKLKPVWRKITKKNERQGDKLFDVLICTHAVPANKNTWRKVRACPTCARVVEEYRQKHAASKRAA